MWALVMVALMAGGTEQEARRTVPFHINFSTLGLGPVIPSTIELDGNPLTTEWLLTSAKPGDDRKWIFNPATYCVSEIEIYTPDLNYSWAEQWVITIARIGLVDKIVLTDINEDDEFLPAKIYEIESPCYPKQ